MGDTVTWTNNDKYDHTVTSDGGPELDSGPIPPGSTYVHTFAKKGLYTYKCSIHNTMTATVDVG